MPRRENRTSAYTNTATLARSDAGRIVEVTKATAVNVTVPPNASVDLPVGTVITVVQMGAGQVTLVPGSGVTLRSSGGKLKTAAQYAVVKLRKRDVNEWVVSGDTAT